MATWVIASVTWRELVRRKLVFALLALTAIVIGVTGWGFSRVPGLHLDGQPLTVYTVFSTTLEFGLVHWTTGYWPGQPIAAEAALLVEGLVLLTFTLALSTRISAFTAIGSARLGNFDRSVVDRALWQERS